MGFELLGNQGNKCFKSEKTVRERTFFISQSSLNKDCDLYYKGTLTLILGSDAFFNVLLSSVCSVASVKGPLISN